MRTLKITFCPAYGPIKQLGLTHVYRKNNWMNSLPTNHLNIPFIVMVENSVMEYI